MLLDFQYLIDQSLPRTDVEEVFDRNQGFLRKRLADNCHLKHITLPEEKKKMLKTIFEGHEQEIMDCRISGDKIIYTVKEVIDQQNIYYLKIFDHKLNILNNYFEFDQLLLSGDKKYVWLPLSNKVYNIEENLSTLFLWAGGQHHTCGFDNMDSFTVSDDASVMSTHGFLHLAFDFVSACLHDNRFTENDED